MHLVSNREQATVERKKEMPTEADEKGRTVDVGGRSRERAERAPTGLGFRSVDPMNSNRMTDTHRHSYQAPFSRGTRRGMGGGGGAMARTVVRFPECAVGPLACILG